MNIRIRHHILYTLFLLLTILTACGLKNSIIGKWQIVGGDEVLQFYKDGTFTISRSFTGTTIGSYEFIEKDTIRLDIPNLFGASSQIFRVELSGGELTLSNNGVSSHYTKR